MLFTINFQKKVLLTNMMIEFSWLLEIYFLNKILELQL